MNDNNTVDIVYQGIPGSYSEASLSEFCKLHGIEVNPVEERGFFEGLFNSITTHTGLGWVPVSNSHAGTVHQSIDMFLSHDVEVLAEYYFDVEHCIAALPGTALEDVATALSHPQALSQCSEFLREHSIAALSYHDTAAAAEYLAKEGKSDQAAICSERAAEKYGLDVLSKKIQNDETNITRFLLVKQKDKNFSFEEGLKKEDSGDYKTTVIFSAKEEAGSLYRAISGFAGAGINMSKIESRRHHTGEHDYLFYLDYDKEISDPASQGALAVLKQNCDLVRVLGSYPKYVK